MARTVSGSNAGNALTFAQLEGVWEQAGGSALMAPLMAAIALAESSGIPTETNPTDNNGKQTSWGLWQISNGDHSEPSPNWADPLENAKLAVAKLKSQGLTAWGTYTSGAYKKFMPSGTVAPTTIGTGGEGAAGQQPTGNPEGSWTSALGTVYQDVTSGLMTIPGAIVGTFGDIDKIFSDFYKGAQLFFQPSTYVRIGAGMAGATLLVVALVLMVKEAST